MYKTSAKVESTRRNCIEVEMNGKMDNVEIYVRNLIDYKIHREAAIDMSPKGFIDLVRPILAAAGYTVIETPEEM